MSVFFKARSGKYSLSFGILLIRLTLGSLFLLAGARKVLDLQAFIRSVQETSNMNESLAFILAFILPFMEMIFGAFYMIGLFTPITSFFISVMTISFLFVLGARSPELPFSYNIVFLSCALATMFTGAGLISFDALLDRKKIVTTSIKGTSTTTSAFVNPNLNPADVVYVDEKDVSSDDEIKG